MCKQKASRVRPRVLTGCLEVWWGLSRGMKFTTGSGFEEVALQMEEMLIRQLDTRSAEEKRRQNGRVGHYPALMMLEPWLRASSWG